MSGPEPSNLRFLRRLVTVLTATMIIGLLVLITLIVIRLQQPAPVALPDTITLPENVVPTAFTRGPNWYAVVTQDNRILIYNLTTGDLRQDITVNAE